MGGRVWNLADCFPLVLYALRAQNGMDRSIHPADRNGHEVSEQVCMVVISVCGVRSFPPDLGRVCRGQAI